MGKTVRKSFCGRNLQQMTRVTWGICLHKNSDPRGLSAPAPGLYSCIKTGKNMYKIRLQRYFFETCNKWAKWQGLSVDIRILSTKVVCPCPGAIYMWKNIKKCLYNQNSKRFVWNLQQMVESDKGFLLTSKCCPQGVFCPCPGAIYMYKIIKNVYKIRFRRDHFETWNIWAKRKGLSVVIKFLSPMGCLPLTGAIYMWKKKTKKKNTHIKTVKNQTSKKFFFTGNKWAKW